MTGTVNQILQGLKNVVTWWVTVTPWEQALRVRFGKHITDLGSGIHLRVPGMHRVYVQSTRLRTSDLGRQTVTTADGQAITISGVLRYTITDLRKLYNTLHHAEATLVDMAMGAVAVFVAGTEIEHCTPGAVEEFVNAMLDLEKYGLEGEGLRITDFAAVRTYRLISGDDRRYQPRGSLDTEGWRAPYSLEG